MLQESAQMGVILKGVIKIRGMPPTNVTDGYMTGRTGLGVKGELGTGAGALGACVRLARVGLDAREGDDVGRGWMGEGRWVSGRVLFASSRDIGSGPLHWEGDDRAGGDGVHVPRMATVSGFQAFVSTKAGRNALSLFSFIHVIAARVDSTGRFAHRSVFGRLPGSRYFRM
jgi:hypothetical protein